MYLTSAERYALAALAYGYGFDQAQKMSGVDARRLAAIWRRERLRQTIRLWLSPFFGGERS